MQDDTIFDRMQDRLDGMRDAVERGRGVFRDAAVASGAVPPPEPSILDHAKTYVADVGVKVYRWVNEKSPWMGARLDDAVAAASDLERKGYANHVRAFNQSLLRPLKDGTSEVVHVIKSTATCAPGQDAKAAFTLWNVLCFWLNVLLLIVDLLLPFGSALTELIGTALGYFTAYTLHFVFLRAPSKRYMLLCLAVLSLYVAFNLMAGFGGLLLVVPGAISFCRAAANAVLLFYAFQLYGRLAGDDAATML